VGRHRHRPHRGHARRARLRGDPAADTRAWR
jgi:hypothetical protein